MKKKGKPFGGRLVFADVEAITELFAKDHPDRKVIEAAIQSYGEHIAGKAVEKERDDTVKVLKQDVKALKGKYEADGIEWAISYIKSRGEKDAD